MIWRLFLVLMICKMWLVAVTLSLTIPIKKHRHCRDGCENSDVKIPFPFGIGPSCYHNTSYEIVCNSSSSGAEIPVLKRFNLEVLSITSCLGNNDTLSGYYCALDMLTLEVVASELQTTHIICSNSSSSNDVKSLDLNGTPFRFSMYNFLVAKGCSGQATISTPRHGELGACALVCIEEDNPIAKQQISTCDGDGCCLTSLSYKNPNVVAFDSYQISLNYAAANTCLSVSLMNFYNPDLEGRSLMYGGTYPKGEMLEPRLSSSHRFSILWHWLPPPLTKTRCNKDRRKIKCHGICGQEYTDEVCTCADHHVGNPYISYGCKDPCLGGSTSLCKRLPEFVGITIGLGTVVFILCCYGLYLLTRKIREIKQRADFFKRNGGLLLQQQINSSEGFVERTKVYPAKELKKATDNFNANRILGQGGQGTVYKGMLTDGKVVAVKKSNKVDEGQKEQFINEVVILSQINHRNVVKLLGCCLETEVPLLVYEFVPNGSLSQHIHNPSDDFHITWKMRLLIAAESAGAIAYLHSSSATPIYHRDIKSSNILLDEGYRAKVSDFGTSRTVMIDQTHLTTRVHGTFGYLDPEYFQSHQFTEKSDVYSFGVVLVELLTGKKPVFTTESEEQQSLVLEFIYLMENSSLLKTLDKQILEETEEEEIMAVANLAMRCLNFNGNQRPTMREVASALEAIRSPISQSAIEMICAEDNQVAMDISRRHGDYMSSYTFCSEDSTNDHDSVETQSLVHNTL